MKRFTLALCACFVLFSCSTDDTPAPLDDSGDNRITSFRLELKQNGKNTAYSGGIDHAAGTITLAPSLAWIENITSARAVFEHEGRSAAVDGVKQVSGTTANDFSRPVAYTVTAGNGDRRTYTVSLSSPQATGLPVVRVVTQNGKDVTSKTTYVPATVSLDNYVNHAHDIAAAPAGIRGRGNSTWWYDKKPYRVRFDEKTAVLGHGKARSWVLLANWLDQTFIMNTVAFELGRRAGIPYTNHAEHVELYLNGSYKGSYLLTEQIQAGTNRVDIDEGKDWLVELDTYDDPYKFYTSGLAMPVNVKSPDLDPLAQPGRNAIISAVKADYEKMENAVMALSGWGGYMDEASFIDFMLINELLRNVELEHPKSTYLWKRDGGKWTWGPLWDFDWGYGTPGSYWSYASTQVYTGRDGSRPGAKFFNKLMQDAQFRKRYKARWNELKPLVSDISIFIGETGGKLELSAIQNKRVWSAQYPLDYKVEIQKMQSWFTQRIAYLDGVINAY